MTGSGHTDAVVEAVLSGTSDDAVPAELERAAVLVRAAQAEPTASEIEMMPPWLLDTLANGIDDRPTAVAHRRAVRVGRRIAVVSTSLVLGGHSIVGGAREHGFDHRIGVTGPSHRVLVSLSTVTTFHPSGSRPADAGPGAG